MNDFDCSYGYHFGEYSFGESKGKNISAFLAHFSVIIKVIKINILLSDENFRNSENRALKY